MVTSAFSNKYFLPPVPANSIRRERLLDSMVSEWQQGRPLINLQAPAGYGKTTTLIQYAHQLQSHGARVVWISLTRDDNHPKQFLQCLLDACHAQEGIIPPPASILETSEARQSIGLILKAITEENARPATIFIDDLHLIQDAATLDLLALLINVAKNKAGLCFASRKPLAIAKSRLKVHGDLYEIKTRDLRFNFEETQKLLDQLPLLSLSDDELKELYQKTDGWPALLVLALVESGEQLDSKKWIEKFSGRQEDVADYLTEEIVNGFPDDLTQSLLQISIVNRFSASLCEALTGIDNLPDKLIKTPAINLLMQRLDNEGQWYSIHPILRDFLKQRLETTLSSQHQQNLYQKASNWYETNGMTFAAVQYAIDAGQQDAALALLQKYGVGLLVESYFPSFLRLIRKFPDEVLSNNPQLLLEQAWALLVMCEVHQCNQVINELSLLYSNSHPMPATVKTEIQSINICSQLYREKTEELLVEAPVFLANNALATEYMINSVRVAYAIGLYRKNRMDEALLEAKACIRENMDSSLRYSASMAWCLCIMIALTRGQMDVAHNELKQYRQFIGESINSDSLIYNYLHAIDAVVSYCSGDVNRAFKLLGNYSVLEGRVVDPALLCWVVPIQARLLDELGRREAAEACLRMSWYFAEEKKLAGLGACAGGELIRLYARSGRMSAAEGLMVKIRNYFKFGQGSQDEWCQRFLTLAEARLAIAECDTAKAGVKLKTLYTELQSQDCQLQALECQLELAESYWVAGKEERCTAILRRALNSPVAEDCLQIFKSADKGTLKYLRKLEANSQSPREKSLIQRILKDLKLDEPTEAISPLSEPLSQGERKVIACLVQGMSNQAIADELGLSINTVKAYLKTAYGKLEVSSRVQVVTRVNELNIKL